MRRGFLLVLTLLPFTAAASAQAPTQAPVPAQPLVQTEAPVQAPAPIHIEATIRSETLESAHGQFVFTAPSPRLVARASPDDLVARIMSFDRNNDGKVTRDELNERMQTLVSRGDVNGDRALDSGELRRLANVAPQDPVSVRGFPTSAGGYGFGDDVGLSSRSHIEGAIEDLRLSAATRERALPLVKTFLDTLETSTRDALLKEMEGLLTAEQLIDFTKALETSGSTHPVALKILAHQADTGAQIDSQIQKFVIEGSVRLTDLHRGSLLIERTLAQYRLPPSQDSQARAAIERYNARFRVGDAERSALLEQLSGILSDEERDNFLAALERRPIVKAGGLRFFTKTSIGGPGPVTITIE